MKHKSGTEQNSKKYNSIVYNNFIMLFWPHVEGCTYPVCELVTVQREDPDYFGALGSLLLQCPGGREGLGTVLKGTSAMHLGTGEQCSITPLSHIFSTGAWIKGISDEDLSNLLLGGLPSLCALELSCKIQSRWANVNVWKAWDKLFPLSIQVLGQIIIWLGRVLSYKGGCYLFCVGFNYNGQRCFITAVFLPNNQPLLLILF